MSLVNFVESFKDNRTPQFSVHFYQSLQGWLCCMSCSVGAVGIYSVELIPSLIFKKKKKTKQNISMVILNNRAILYTRVNEVCLPYILRSFKTHAIRRETTVLSEWHDTESS